MVEQIAENTRKAVGASIKQLRTAQGLSLRKFALMVDMDYAYLCNIENGKANATIDTLVKISNGLGNKIRDLF